MTWIVGLVWGAAVLIALIVLGFCAYELAWKSKRLSRDLAGLLAVRDDLASLQQRLADVQQRIPGR